MNIREALRQYISEELLEEEEAPVEDDENLLADGMVDSLGMLRLVAFIEESYEISVPPQDFTIENFRTIETLDNYLSSKVVNLNAGPHRPGADPAGRDRCPDRGRPRVTAIRASWPYDSTISVTG